MGSKKDIGSVFKDRLGELKETPSDNLWNAIASEMDQGTKRRILPFWYYTGGGLIAALVIGLSIWSPMDNNSNPKESITTVSEEIDINSNNSNSQKLNPSNQNFSLDTLVNQDSSSVAIKPILSHSSSKDAQELITNTSKKEIINAEQKETATNNANNNIYKAISVFTNKESSSSNNSQNRNTPSNNSLGLQNTTLQDIKRKLKNYSPTISPEELKARALYNAKIQKELQEAIQAQLAENESFYQAQLKSEALAEATKKVTEQKEQAITSATKNIKTKITKSPLTDEERALKRQAATEYKIAFTPYTSLLSYGSLVRGSSIDDRLVNNPREAIPTVGYGFRVDYPLSKKSSLRFGVGVAPLRYRTDNFQVSFVNGNINIFQLTAINAQDINQPSLETSPEAQTFFEQNQVVSIEQDISYLEVPVDYQYKFINKRIGLSLNSGLSLFVLNNNALFATSDNGDELLIGRQTNLRDLSFAANLGLSAHYNFSRRWRFDAEPAFKYQVNPFTSTNTNFRPFYFGMQFGLSFKY